MLRGRAALVAALVVPGLVGLVGCSFDRRDDTLTAQPIPTVTVVTVATTGTSAPAVACGGPCPAFYGDRPTIDYGAFTAVCASAHDQFWTQFVGTSDPASVSRFTAAMVAIGASPDVVAAGQRWAQVRVDNVSRHQAAFTRAAGGADLARDPDYAVVYAAFTSARYVADDALVVSTISTRCAATTVAPPTK